jgi:asparagine synthase (glutamine-hydrolysing)
MPGIVGIVSQRSAEECQDLVKSMVSSLEHESFYDSGMYSVPEMGIYAGWVAHENSFASGQVFFNERKDIVLLFSGECFVDPETRAKIKGRGHELGTAVGSLLVHLYEEEDDQFFEKLNGLFSGLLIDKRQSKTFLFNDRYGLERIYFCETKDATYFASEAKALLRILPELRAFDERGVVQFLNYGCTLDWRTLFRGVHLLPGGSLWSFEGGICRKTKYFSPETWVSQSTLSAESFESQFQETFKKILPRYFESNSKIGIALTGGLDGRMIMACRPYTAEEPVCYTFSGENRQTLDGRLAARIAKACDLEHRLLRIGPDFFSDFASHVDRTVNTTDGCFGAVGAHEIYLNAQARQLAPVRLTGVFGGEILREVSSFKLVGISPQLTNPEFHRNTNSLAGELAKGEVHPVTFAAFKEVPWNIFGSVAACRSQVTFRTPYLDNEIVALAFRAPENLRTSIHPTLSLVKNNSPRLSKIPTDMGEMGEANRLAAASRRIFAKAVCKLDYYNSEGLPDFLSALDPVLRRVSSGLGILGLHKYLPYRHWFRRELAGYLNDVLEDVRTRQSPLWNSDFLDHLASDHIAGRKNYVREINAVLTLHAVERLLIQN